MIKVTKQGLIQLAENGNTVVIVGDDFKGSILDYAPIRNRVTMVTMVEEHIDMPDTRMEKDNPISEYATPALMLQGYYDGHVDRDAMLRTFDEASVYHVVCDVTGLITLEDPMVPKSLSQATHQSSQHKPIR